MSFVASVYPGPGPSEREGFGKSIEGFLRSSLIEMATRGLIPVRSEISELAERAASKIKISWTPTGSSFYSFPEIGLTTVLDEIFGTARTPVPQFLRPPTQAYTVSPEEAEVEELTLDLERRSLENILDPQRSATARRLAGRARIAAAVKETLKEVEKKREKEAEEARKEEKLEADLKENGFGRKLDLD